MQPHERIYVAVDTNDVSKALSLAEALKGKVGGFKIGLEFITSVIVKLAVLPIMEVNGLLANFRLLLQTIGSDLFWDGKFDDIPNTVGGASLGLGLLSPKFFNVHASSGSEAVAKAVGNKGASKVLAVTLLTSFDMRASIDFFGQAPEIMVPRWAELAVEAGADGLICSPADLAIVNRFEKLKDVPKMTPGIRPLWSLKAGNDQARIMTPAQALVAGSTWMVIGRPITGYPEGPVKAVERIVDEIDKAELDAICG